MRSGQGEHTLRIARQLEPTRCPTSEYAVIRDYPEIWLQHQQTAADCYQLLRKSFLTGGGNQMSSNGLDQGQSGL